MLFCGNCRDMAINYRCTWELSCDNVIGDPEVQKVWYLRIQKLRQADMWLQKDSQKHTPEVIGEMHWRKRLLGSWKVVSERELFQFKKILLKFFRNRWHILQKIKDYVLAWRRINGRSTEDSCFELTVFRSICNALWKKVMKKNSCDMPPLDSGGKI